VEPLGAQRSDLAHPTRTLDPRDQSCRGLAPLLDGGPLQVRHPGQPRNTEHRYTSTRTALQRWSIALWGASLGARCARCR
jgi:hypothetical protein